MGSWVERTHSKAVAGRPREVADCGAGWAKLQLAARQQLVDRVTDWATPSSSVAQRHQKAGHPCKVSELGIERRCFSQINCMTTESLKENGNSN